MRRRCGRKRALGTRAPMRLPQAADQRWSLDFASDVLADGRPLGAFAADRLAAGVNISSATADGWEPGGPWDAQAAMLIRLTDARSEVVEARGLAGDYLPGHPERDALEEQAEEADARLVDLQRTLVQPRPFRFVVRPAESETP